MTVRRTKQAETILELRRTLADAGRYAWLLTDVTPTTVRCPVCQDNATGRERAWHQTHSGGICDAAHGSCFTPWCRCRCHVEARCPVCRGVGRCDPIPAKGRQGPF